ncbi:MAG: YCII-related domain protein [Noviherbaspirillum sp.]|jgi:uncharacterized protein YciI|nr:YCII-related domain protein [Noviherbaspirillum sp.]
MGMYALIYKIVDMEKNAANRPAHVEFLRSLLREGKIQTGWKFPDYQAGLIQAVLICKAGSKEEVAGWFEKDPVIMAGARTFEVRDAEKMAIEF